MQEPKGSATRRTVACPLTAWDCVPWREPPAGVAFRPLTGLTAQTCLAVLPGRPAQPFGACSTPCPGLADTGASRPWFSDMSGHCHPARGHRRALACHPPCRHLLRKLGAANRTEAVTAPVSLA